MVLISQPVELHLRQKRGMLNHPAANRYYVRWGQSSNTFSSLNPQKMELAMPGGGGVLPSERLLGMRRWMGAHFHNWIDYNGVTRMGSHIFG